MRNGSTEPIDAVTAQCMADKRITKDNYACLLAATSSNGLDACFAGAKAVASARFVADRKKACADYARHVLALMADDLRKTTTDMCMSERVTKADYDCVMEARTDQEFKHCLGR